MGKFNKGYHCWLINISKKKIVLGDLGFTLQPRQTIDILDDKHSNYTVEEVEKSINGGSISKRLNREIYIRMVPPPKQQARKLQVSKTSFPYKQRTIVEIEEPNYEELNLDIGISDEEFANENADEAGIEGEIHLATKNKKE